MLIYRNEQAYCGPISMVRRLADGDLVVVFREALWRGFLTHCDPTTRTSLIRSSDGGRTWHSQVSPDPGGGNGCVLAALRDGTLIESNFHWLFVPPGRRSELQGRGKIIDHTPLEACCAGDGIRVARSVTRGFTWGPPRKVDVPQLVAPHTAGRIVELDDSTLLMPVNGTLSEGGPVRSFCLRSNDGGESWDELSAMPPAAAEADLHETRIVALPGNRVLALMRTEDGNFRRCASGDAGRTWGELSDTPIWCGGSSPADLLLLEDGRLLCTYGHRREPFGVRACLSEDGGETWNTDAEVVLRDDGPDRDMGYPSSEQLADGRILTVYYWHDDDGIRHLQGTLWDA